MFFRNKQKEDERKEMLAISQKGTEDVKKQLLQFQEQWTSEKQEQHQITEEITRRQQEQLEAIEKLTTQLNSLDETIKGSEKQIRRQSRSFEDLLEEIQDQQKEKELLEQLLKEKEQQEKALLSLIDCCRGHTELFQQQLQKTVFQDEENRQAWQQQLQMMDSEIKKLMQQCGMEEVGAPEELVNYDYCEVLEAIETENENQVGRIAKVYHQGRLYCGKVIAKAQVAAYRRRVNGLQ